MFFSKKEKLIFFHIPKTAGNSIRHFLEVSCSDGKYFTDHTFELYKNIYGLKYKSYLEISKGTKNLNFIHLTQAQGSDILKTLNINLDDFTEFVVVRNPCDRLLSFYNFTLHKDYKSIDNLLNALEEGKISPALHLKSQLDYIKNPITKNLKIFKYEELDKCEEFLQKHLTTSIQLPKINITKNQIIDKFSYEVKERIYNLLKDEFVEFGYKI